MPRNVGADRGLLAMALAGYKAQLEKINAAIAEIQARLGKGSSTSPSSAQKHRMNAAARKRIAAAQRKRWAAVRKAEAEPAKPKPRLSAAGRKAIIAATKKRWAAVRKAAGQKAAPHK